MRISDWSSDVCSSDLQPGPALLVVALPMRGVGRLTRGRDHRARLEHEGHGVGDDVRLRQVRGGRLLERRRVRPVPGHARSEEHTSELQSLMRIYYGVFCTK